MAEMMLCVKCSRLRGIVGVGELFSASLYLFLSLSENCSAIWLIALDHEITWLALWIGEHQRTPNQIPMCGAKIWKPTTSRAKRRVYLFPNTTATHLLAELYALSLPTKISDDLFLRTATYTVI